MVFLCFFPGVFFYDGPKRLTLVYYIWTLKDKVSMERYLRQCTKFGFDDT